MAERKPTQNDRILAHLRAGESISALEALDRYGCFRLASRINDLKNQGYVIGSKRWKTPGGATIARYNLIAEPEGQVEMSLDAE
tara:strand:- start:64 stop:315 length:252 start_codon:yes stop_codon:yes gene_type:complete